MNKLNHYFTIVIGICWAAYGIYCIFKGTTYGYSCGIVALQSNPVEFWVSVTVSIIFGGLLVWGGIEKLNYNGLKENQRKPWEIEIK